MTTLTNIYHRTTAQTRATEADLDRIGNTQPEYRTPSERRLVARLRKKLCGVSGCTCCDDMGVRA